MSGLFGTLAKWAPPSPIPKKMQVKELEPAYILSGGKEEPRSMATLPRPLEKK